MWCDGGYAGQLVDWTGATLKLSVEIVRKLAGQTGFHVLPRRWVAERTFSWINRCRRTARDYERLPATGGGLSGTGGAEASGSGAGSAIARVRKARSASE